MVTTRELKGSKDQIVRQIQNMDGQILSALLIVEEPAAKREETISAGEMERLLAEMAADSVGVPHADDSREAIYTRMAGE